MASLARGGLDLDKIWPIGSVYISVNSTDPSSLFGGKWEQLKGRFLIGTGTVDSNTTDYWGTIKNNFNMPLGEKGGEDYHKLSLAESPSHNHRDLYWGNGTSNQFGVNRTAGGGMWGFDYWSTSSNCSEANFYTNYVGGGQAHNNMPPYLAVYMWKRVS